MTGRERVLERLRASARRLRLAAALRGAADLLVLVVLILAACYLLDRFLDLRRQTRLFLSAAFLAGAAFLLFRRVVRPLVMRLPERSAARLVEGRLPSLGGALVTVVEVEGPALVMERLGAEVYGVLSGFPAGLLVDGRKLVRSLVAGAAAAALAAAFVLSSPAQAAAFLARFCGADVPYPVKPAIALDIPPRLRVAEGSNVIVRARELNGYEFRRLVLEIKGPSYRTLLMKPAGEGVFEAELRNVRGTCEVVARAGSKRSRTHVIEAVPRPELRSVALTVVPPSYTGRKPVTLMKGQLSASVLAGSEIVFEIQSTKPLTAAFLAFPDGGRKGLVVDGSKGSVRLKVERDLACTFELLDEEGFSSPPLPVCRIKAVPDKPPVVTLESPKANRRIVPDGAFRLRCRVRDDFAVAGVALLIAVPETGAKKRVPLSAGRGEDVKLEDIVPVGDLKAVPGQTLQVRIEARDSSPSGNAALSEPVTLRVSRPYEILDELQAFIVNAKQRLKTLIAEEDAVLAALGKTAARRLLVRQRRVLRGVQAMAPDFAMAADDFRLNRLGEEEAQLLDSIARALEEGCAGPGAASLSALSVLVSSGASDEKDARREIARFKRVLARQLERLDKFENYSELTRQIREMIDKEREIREMLKKLLEKDFAR